MATNPSEIIADAPTDTKAPAEVSASDFYQEGKDGNEAQPGNEQAEPQEGATGHEGEAVEADLEPVASPNSWSKEDKEIFAGLPREAQEIIARRETERDRFVAQKGNEAQTVRRQIEGEARQAFAQLQRNHADELQRYAQQFEAQAPDERLLYTGNPEHQALYMQQQARYQSTIAQRQMAQQEADTARQRAEVIENQQREQEVQEQHRILAEAIPEWSEPSSRAKLLSELQPIATELGYSDEVMSNANAADILALRKISDYRSKAAKYDELMKKKMAPVRAAKGNNIPPAGRTVGTTGNGQATDAISLLYPNDVRRN